jgi:hypothetical protein
MNIAARAVDHLATRLAFGALGLVVAGVFILFGLDFLRVDPLAEPESFSIGLCMLLGQAGWWGRVCTRHSWLAARPVARRTVIVLLCIGIATVLYGLAFMPKGPLALPVLLALLASGVLMVLGTVDSPRPGPNNSFKPKPLRGSA